MKIYEIFEKYGEEKFRDIEHEEIKKIDRRSNNIISTGGGAFTFPNACLFLLRVSLSPALNPGPNLRQKAPNGPFWEKAGARSSRDYSSDALRTTIPVFRAPFETVSGGGGFPSRSASLRDGDPSTRV